ncbi:MAG TPA: hypothetical protein VFX98_17020 [Longimicrobiaceae bacterium]|nr:hypothetical protein [Longimicrobiaceae bacterium]
MTRAILAAALVLAASSTPAHAQAPVLRWDAGPSLAQGRDHHATFVAGEGARAHLYVAGGNTYGSVLADVWRAPIRRDGTLGAWAASDPLPSPRAGHGVAVAGRHVVVTAGQAPDRSYLTETLVATARPDGTLGPWRAQAPLPAPRFHHASVHHRGWVYVVGGLENQRSTASVYRARVGADGRIAAWDSLAPLPRPRSHQGSFVHGDALYLVAGLDGNPAGQHEPLRDVIRARIHPNGSLGPWETVGTLPHAYGTHASFAHGGFAWLLGGVEDNARFVDVVLRAPLRPDGTLGEWARVERRLPNARSHVHQTPVHRGRVYSVAGSNARRVNGEAWVGTFR